MVCGYSQKRRERKRRNLFFFSPLNPETVSSERHSDTEEADLHELYLPSIRDWGVGRQKKKKKPEFVNVQSVIFQLCLLNWDGEKKKFSKSFGNDCSMSIFP